MRAVIIVAFSACVFAMDNAVLRFSFDEDKGQTVSEAAGSITGTIQNALWTDGIRGAALRFDPASKSAVTVKTALRELSAISVSLWFRGDADQKDPHLVSCIGDGKQGFRIFMNGEVLIWQIPSPEVAWGYRLGATAVCPSGQWNHAVCTYDGSAMYIYINGKAVGTLKRSGSVMPSPVLFIGAYSDGGTAVFSGVIDEVAVYDRALSIDEVKSLNEAARAGASVPAKAVRADINSGIIESMRSLPNELKNPQFEDGAVQWRLDAPWEIGKDGVGGSQCAVLDYDKDKHHKFIDQAVPVASNTYYGMRLWVRSEIQDASHIIRGFTCFAGDVKNTPLYTYTGNNIEFDYWVPVYHYFNSGESTTARFSAYLQDYGVSGKVWLDDAALWKCTDDMIKGNLIPNAEFELSADGDFPVCWLDGLAWQKDKRPPLKISVDRGGKFIKGERSLKLDGSSFTSPDMENGVVSVAVPAVSGKEYQLSVWMKAEKPDTMARLMIDGYIAGKTHWFKQTYVTLDTSWRRYTFEARIPDASDAKYFLPARLVMARIMVKGPNIIWADEVRLTQK